MIGTLLLTIALTAPSLAQSEAPPDSSLQEFYTWVLAGKHSEISLPSAKEREQLKHFFAPAMISLMENASATEARCAKVVPAGDKPLLMEGALFVTNYEGASEAAYGDRVGDDRSVSYVVTLAYIDNRYAKGNKFRTAVWQDRIQFTREHDQWRIANIYFQSDKNSPWGAKTSLTDSLTSFIADGKSCSAP